MKCVLAAFRYKHYIYLSLERNSLELIIADLSHFNLFLIAANEQKEQDINLKTEWRIIEGNVNCWVDYFPTILNRVLFANKQS